MSRLLIQFSHLYKSFGASLLFDDISLSVHQGEVFALIGENGSGKTTLLNLLAGLTEPDSSVISRTSELSIGLLPQEIILSDPSITVRNYLTGTVLIELERNMAQCLEDPTRLEEWEELHHTYVQLGGYHTAPIEEIIQGLCIDNKILDDSMSILSSGQRVRIALGRVLIENPDLLLLDEPTNHLDYDMLNWLEAYLNKRIGATIVVSHDRKFLNKTCNRLIEINEAKLSYYSGGYDFYLAEKERRLEKDVKAYEAQREERSLLKQKIKAITFSTGKASPPKDRNVMAYDRRGEKQQRSLHHTLDVLKARLADLEATPLHHPKPKGITGLHFDQVSLTSPVAIELEEAGKGFGGRILFSDLSKSIYCGDRIVMIGPNGCGKTTLLKAMAGLLPLDHGIVKHAPSAKIGFLDQDVELLPMDESPLHYFERRYQLSEEELRRELHKAALGGENLLERPFSTLSTGQRKRMMLLTLILERPNVLLLDEPTNHLDLSTLEALEKALLNFEGALVTITHDATFMERIATTEWRILDQR